MKKVLGLLMVLSLVAIAGCEEGRMSAWALTSQDTDLIGRVGYDVDGIELGATAKWHPADEIDWGPEPQAVGAYCIVEATWDVQATDTEPRAFAPVSWLENLHATPYVGIEVIDDCDNDNLSNLQPNWIVGTKFRVKPDGKSAIIVEYVDGDQQRGDVSIGAMLSF